MTAMNIVHMRVKPGMEEEFLSLHRTMLQDERPLGARAAWVVKTGERSYCFVAEWDSFDDIVHARPQMIGQLDRTRTLLEDLGGGRGVTEPYSGEVVLEEKG